LPDKSLSPLERIERLGRVVPHAVQVSANHLTARSKLNAIRSRLCELAPREGMSEEEIVDWLVEKIIAQVPGKYERLIERLSQIEDDRLRDNGSLPSHEWTPKKTGLAIDYKHMEGTDPDREPSTS